MKTVGQLLDQKGHQIYSVDPDAPVFEAIKLMQEHGVGALLVMKNRRLVGIISERDYARKVILKGRSSKTTPIRDIMTAPVVCIGPERSIEECMALMTDKRVRHLPVLKGMELVGIVSIGDVVKATIAEQKFLIDQLERYITGG